MILTSFSRIGLIVLLLLLSACASEKPSGGWSGGQAGAPHYKVGQPYQINGNWYYPKEDYSYDESGIASWYGQDFHGKYTANGEIFNKNELTAAHATLPMPSLARVTNLDNGRSIVVRINDRGPFARSRIIDVTQRASQLLGFEQQGTAKVRVQVLADESKAIADAMRRYGSTSVATASVPTPAPVASITSQPLENTPLPMTRQEVKQALATIKPVPEVKQVPVASGSEIYVQAGAFTKVDNAERLKLKLMQLGTASISEFANKGTIFYRVRLGPLDNVAAADALLKRVLKAGSDNARIIVD